MPNISCYIYSLYSVISCTTYTLCSYRAYNC